jgi:hypothetical protein
MGSGDLNMKKSWHPQRSGNIAATNKAEAEAIAERKKLQQRLQEIEEERKKEEIQKALEAAGGKPRLQRVEWMYSGPNDGQAGDAAENEAYLLGKRRIDKLLQDNDTIKKLQKQPSQDTLEAAPAAAVANARDIATKIREDPLLAIKRQEQQAYEAMMNDPIRRRQLLASMGIDDSQDKADKAKRKEERRHKHRHSHRSHRHRDDDRDGERHSRRRRSDSRDRSRSPKRYESGEEDRKRRRRGSRERRRDRSGSADSRDRRERRDGRDRRSSRDRRDRRDREEGSREDKHRDSRPKMDSRSPSPPRKRGYSPERDDRKRRDRSMERPSSARRHNDGDANGYHNGGGPPRPCRDYDDRRDRAPPKPRASGPSSGGAGGKGVDEEERARKLAAMREAATDLDQDRQRRLALLAEKEGEAQETDERARERNKRFGGDAGFMNQLHSRATELKVADRVGRR